MPMTSAVGISSSTVKASPAQPMAMRAPFSLTRNIPASVITGGTRMTSPPTLHAKLYRLLRPDADDERGRDQQQHGEGQSGAADGDARAVLAHQKHPRQRDHRRHEDDQPTHAPREVVSPAASRCR